MTTEHNPLIYTDKELLHYCASSHNALTRKAGERWQTALNDLAAARADAARCAYIRDVECNGDPERWNATVDAQRAKEAR